MCQECSGLRPAPVVVVDGSTLKVRRADLDGMRWAVIGRILFVECGVDAAVVAGEMRGESSRDELELASQRALAHYWLRF